MANTVLRKDYSGAGNKQRQTISVWVKRCAGLSGNQAIFSVRHTGNSNFYGYLRFKTDSSLEYYINNPSIQMITNRKFRDTNAWYHIVITLDTTQSTEADRLKIYINGVQETSFQTATYPSQNAEVTFGDDYRHEIGSYDSSYYFEGVMSHFYFITNTAYQASTFGSTDSTTGEWQITTSPTITYATNSFFILKDGNSVTDLSGQGNNYTVAGGTLTKTEDNPSNVFNILNPLYLSASKFNFIQGNLRSNGWSSGTSQTWRSIYGTLGASSGKYYFEMKCDNMYSGDTGNIALGIVSDDQVVQTADNSKFFNGSTAYAYAGNGQKLNNDDSIAGGDSYGSSFTTNDIISCAYDLDNGKIYWAKNGTWANSGDPTSGSTGTGSAFNLTANLTYLPAVANYYDDDRWSFNFGNGYFGATAVASAGTNASGNGIFEYDVPTGYTALSTKGLNT